MIPANPSMLSSDAHNQRLLDQVRPAQWQNPEPQGRYNLVVVGGGTAGLVSAAGAAGLGAKVALVERNLLGGDCLNVGCVPSKMLISAARAAAAVHQAAAFGVHAEAKVDFPQVMSRLRRLRADIAQYDSAERFKSLGVDVFLGQGQFTGPGSLAVNGKTLRFAKAVIATGARAILPPIPGLAEAGALTNEDVFNLTELPRRLAVIGGGPIGCELAQAFAHLGSQVWQIDLAPHLLPREDAPAAAVVQAALEQDGVHLRLQTRTLGVELQGPDKVIKLEGPQGPEALTVDEILVAVGRAPNVEGLGLEAAGVEFDRQGVRVNDRLRTSNHRIFAAGDICSIYKFTHAADFMARAAIQNALFMGRKKASELLIPWCTYTSPEIAHVGLYESEATQRGIQAAVFTKRFADVDRAVASGETEGFVSILADRRGKILGATIVGAHAGDMISELTVAMRAGMGLGTLASVIHPYPTLSEAMRHCGDQYNRTRLTPRIAGLLRNWLRWTR